MKRVSLNLNGKRSTLKSVFAWIDKLSAYSGYFTAGLSILMTLMITLGVIMRYIFSAPVFWVDEVSGYFFVAYISLGIVFATLKESHVSCEMIISNMPMKVQYSVAILGYILALLVSSAMIYYGWQTTLLYYTLGWRSETTLGVILWPVWAMIPLGFLLFALASISKIYTLTLRMSNTGSIKAPEC